MPAPQTACHLSECDCLQIHWPGFPIVNNWATNTFVEGLGRAKLAGLTDAVGVSNFKADRVREASQLLQVCYLPSLIAKIWISFQ